MSGVVDVWRADLEDRPRREVDALVTDDDRRAARRFRREVDAQRLLLRRSLLRFAAASRLRLSAQEVTIGRRCPTCGSGDHGRPVVLEPGDAPLALSVSSSGSRALVAVADGPAVGVDVEATVRPFPLAARDHRVFAPAERTLLAAAGSRRDELAYRLWTRKEAVLKCLTRGLDALGAVDCSRGGDGWSRDVVDGSTVARCDVISQGYAAAVAVAGPTPDLAIHEWPP